MSAARMKTPFTAPRKRIVEIDWRGKLRKAWLLRIGTVLTAAEVVDLVAEFNAMCAERAKGKR